jgi:uncharacterized damage-inducible protein DinB
MIDDFAALFAYNRWADRRMLAACRKLTPEQYAAEPVPGWSSVRSSVAHIAIVTEGWLRGVAGEAVESWPTEQDLPSVDDAERMLDRADQIFHEVVSALTLAQLTTPRTFRGRSRVAVLPPWVVLRHLGIIPPTTADRSRPSSSGSASSRRVRTWSSGLWNRSRSRHR